MAFAASRMTAMARRLSVGNGGYRQLAQGAMERAYMGRAFRRNRKALDTAKKIRNRRPVVMTDRQWLRRK